MNPSWSTRNRPSNVAALAAQPLDLLVIGGGITGAGIALDAQVRGLTTAVIDMQDFAAGTSSRSTKLVHGGLRYLLQLQFKLVAEVGRERAIVYRNAPHVTTPLWMMLPIYEHGTFGKLSTSIGLMLYDLLAGVKHAERRKMLDRATALQKVPHLQQQGLQGAGYYVEYRTDDARLTLEILKEAVRRGTHAINYMRAERPLYERKDGRKKLCGFEVRDLLTDEVFPVYASKIVNATGPWVDTLREADHSKEGKKLRLTKGVHLVVSGDRFPLQEAIYFVTPFRDGRMMFAIPRNKKTYIGTTDTNYDEQIAHPSITTDDVRYILDAVNGTFAGLRLTTQDVESSWAGLRPLIHEEGKDPSEISRKDEVFISPSGLISIAGGKLTGYRKMAQKIVDLVTGELHKETGRVFPPCTTENVILSGGEIAPEDFPQFVREMTAVGVHHGLTEAQARTLASTYGTNVEKLFEYVKQAADTGATLLDPAVYATLRYAIDHELAATPADYFVRRTSQLYFDIEAVRRWKMPVIRGMADYLHWTEAQTTAHTAQLEEEIATATEARPSRST